MVIKIMPGHVFDRGMQESISFYDSAGKEAHKDSVVFKGNPLGKRPDAMFKAVLVRFDQCLSEHAEKVKDVDSHRTEEQIAFQTLQDAARRATADHSRITAMRCFRIQAEEDGIQIVKWIFFSSSETAVMQAFRLLRDRGTVLAPGLLLDYDATPRSGRSKKIHGMLAALSLGGARESKSTSSTKVGLEGHGRSSPIHCRGK